MAFPRLFIGALGTLLLCVASAQGLIINEVDYDQSGTDTAEFIEIKNASDTTASLDGVTLELVNGSNGSVEEIAPSAMSLSAFGYYVLCTDNTTVANCDEASLGSIQNGSPDGIRLMDGDTVLDALSYEGDMAGVTEGSGVGLEDTGAGSLARTPDGTDTDQNNVDFTL